MSDDSIVPKDILIQKVMKFQNDVKDELRYYRKPVNLKDCVVSEKDITEMHWYEQRNSQLLLALTHLLKNALKQNKLQHLAEHIDRWEDDKI